MLPLKLFRSLVLGETPPFLPQSHNHHHQDDDTDKDNGNDDRSIRSHIHHHSQIKETEFTSTRRRGKSKSKSRRKISRPKIPLLLFVPSRELVTDTYRLATIARDLGMDLRPTPSLSHIIFSYPSSSISPSSSSSKSSSFPSSWSSSSFSISLPNDAVPIPFPSFATSSLTHLRSFVALTKGLFKLVFLDSEYSSSINEGNWENTVDWNCCSISMFSRLTGNRIDSMDDFSRALAGLGWTLYKTKNAALPDSEGRRACGDIQMYLFRKVESSRIRARVVNGDAVAAAEECSRIRELRLPPLDFRNAPLRILQYILLMTDDIFYLA